MGKRKRRRFTPQQKAQAVEIVRSSGKSVTEVARDLDLTPSTVFRGGAGVMRQLPWGRLRRVRYRSFLHRCGSDPRPQHRLALTVAAPPKARAEFDDILAHLQAA